MRRNRVLIADKIEIYREGLTAILGKSPNMEIVGQCDNGEEAIDKAFKLRPDILLLDENISHPDCLEVTKRIRASNLRIHIIIFTQPIYEERDPFYIFRTQASGYVDREITSISLLNCIQGVLKGDFFVSPDQGRMLVQELNHLKIGSEEKEQPSLSNRERDVISLVIKGLTNRQIADKLFITENTVKAHVTRIMQKMHVQNRQQLSIAAMEKGIVHRDKA